MSTKIGVGACLFGGALVSAGVAQAQVSNGSFESGDFTDWNLSNSQTSDFQYVAVRPAGSPAYIGGYFTNSFSGGFPVTDGQFSASHGFDGSGGTISISQTAFINGTDLTFDWGAAAYLAFGGSADRVFNVNIRDAGSGALLDSTELVSWPANGGQFDTGIVNDSIDVSAFTGTNATIEFEWIIPEPFTGPAGSFVDNVSIIPAPGAAVCFVGASGFMLRRRR